MAHVTPPGPPPHPTLVKDPWPPCHTLGLLHPNYERLFSSVHVTAQFSLEKSYLEKVSWWYWSGFALMHFALTFIRPLCRSWRHWGWNLARLHPSPLPILCLCCHTIPYQAALYQTKFSSSAFPGLECCFSCCHNMYLTILHHNVSYCIIL